MPSPIMRAESPQMRVTIVTLDMHLARAIAQVQRDLRREIPGLSLSLHAAADWDGDPASLARCEADIAAANIVIVTMIFLEDQVRAILPALQARREDCDAMIAMMSAPDIVKLTKLGPFRMDRPQSGAMAWLKKLRGSPKTPGQSAGSGQMAMLRRLPKLLRLIPGTAQDARVYFLAMQYWLAGSETNIANMVCALVNRYADRERRGLRGTLSVKAPVEYPDVGVYHPRIKGAIAERLDALPAPREGTVGTVGVIILRSYALAGDSAHYDGVISALESKGLRVIPAFASGLDARPAIEKFFVKSGRASVDAIVSLTGFSLVGGPAYNDAAAAQELLARLDVPYIAAMPIEFQSLEGWGNSSMGLTAVESTIMVAIPELDGAIAPSVFGGRAEKDGGCHNCRHNCKPTIEGDSETQRMQPCLERANALAARVLRFVELRIAERKQRKLAIVLFNFPPNAGATGTAAYLSVFASLYNTLKGLKAEGYDVRVPESVDALRDGLLTGNAARYGTDANVHAFIPTGDHIRREPHLAAIEKQWGAAPGKLLTNGSSIFVLGQQFGNILVALQPGFGYEGDPMRLLFEGGFAPTHAFSAFYRYLREDFRAHAVLHFGTHGALEFMPGKQVGLSGSCWPERLIGDLPNFNLYAANNPSEGAIAKRRAAATLISYLTPPVAQAGLYKGLLDLKASVDRWRGTAVDASVEREDLAALIFEQAQALDLGAQLQGWHEDPSATVAALGARLYEYEQTLIPEGLHVLGEPTPPAVRVEMLKAIANTRENVEPSLASIEGLVAGMDAAAAAARSGLAEGPERTALFRELHATNRHLAQDTEIGAIVHALDGGFVRPSPGGDLMRTSEILPTGRNLHGFDPFRLPSAFALEDGARQAQRIIDRHLAEGAPLPETIAFVLWGTDNLKSEGAPIGQVLSLMGARARFDHYGRLCGAELIPLAELGRPRIDVMTTVSGIFRDLLPLQTRLLADAAFLAATADEPSELNFVRKHALAQRAELGCDLETSALRVFSNADGAYGANVNQMIDAGCWGEGEELADAYETRKCFAYGRSGKPTRQPALLGKVLKSVDLAYQNLDSLDLGVTTIDKYFDTLGGISQAAKRAKGAEIPVYIGDQTQGGGKVRTLAEQVTLETRTRTLNPRWYDGMLQHGYEGVRQIEAQVTNTLGWSATTAQVDPWIYQRISETFVLDEAMRTRLADLNPKASARMANRLLEAHERNYWTPDAATLEALRRAGDEIEDRLEGIMVAAE